jgi:hypothetical protein
MQLLRSHRTIVLVLVLVALAKERVHAAEEAQRTPRQISGIYPHLACFNNENECGIGAVVPWADRLWVITYAPHRPQGSSDKLYEITSDLQQIVRPESVGGTPANRMIHDESQQLFIGPYVIDAKRAVRVIPPGKMFGRLTGNARHLFEPQRKIYFATMEEGIYEVDVDSLKVTELWADEQRPSGQHANLPGYHGKGLFSGQERLIYANNGEHGPEALKRPEIPSGVLAEWDGHASGWTIVRRNQFTEVTGPGGLHGNADPAHDPVWAMGWDHRSLILQVLDQGRWHGYRLPKSSHSYDGAHGWNTEWPRIREIGEDDLLMTMHGAFWRFPRNFRPSHSAGIIPRSNFLKVVGDFCRWGDSIVLGCDDAARSEFLNKRKLKGKVAATGQSQSNLRFLKPAELDQLGPVIGRGAVWINENVTSGQPSDPYLFAGYEGRSLSLTHRSARAVSFRLEVDRSGDGNWSLLREVTVDAGKPFWTSFDANESGAWIRMIPAVDADAVTAVFQYTNRDRRTVQPDPMFSGLAQLSDTDVTGGLLHSRGENLRTLRFAARDEQGAVGGYDLDENLRLKKVDDAAGIRWMEENLAPPGDAITIEPASVLYVDDQGGRWRLPRGDAGYDEAGRVTPVRVCREVCTERDLLNVHGTFYELPAENAGGFARIRPIASHRLRISDFTSYRGLLVISGVSRDANLENDHLIRSEDGRCALWVGCVDDLWKLGKPNGIGGPWNHADVQAEQVSDPYLMTGYDRKRVVCSHTSEAPVQFTLEADFTGTGNWTPVQVLTVEPHQELEYQFPDAFACYWIRAAVNRPTTATVTFVYE